MKLLAIVLGFTGAVSVAAVSLMGAPASGPVQFRPHDIDTNYRGGYAVTVADFNKDGNLDVMANSLAVSEVGWYENPSWQRHVIVPTGEWVYLRLDNTKAMNDCVSADMNNDRRPDLVCTGAGAAVRWYENAGPASAHRSGQQ